MNFINSLSLILFSFNIVNFSSSNISDTTNIFNIENNEIYILKDRYFTEDNVNEVNYETYTFNFSLSNITIDVSNELIINFNNEDYLDYINVSSINYDSNLNSYSFDITGINKKENSPLIFTINYLDYTSEEISVYVFESYFDTTSKEITKPSETTFTFKLMDGVDIVNVSQTDIVYDEINDPNNVIEIDESPLVTDIPYGITINTLENTGEAIIRCSYIHNESLIKYFDISIRIIDLDEYFYIYELNENSGDLEPYNLENTLELEAFSKKDLYIGNNLDYFNPDDIIINVSNNNKETLEILDTSNVAIDNRTYLKLTIVPSNYLDERIIDINISTSSNINNVQTINLKVIPSEYNIEIDSETLPIYPNKFSFINPPTINELKSLISVTNYPSLTNNDIKLINFNGGEQVNYRLGKQRLYIKISSINGSGIDKYSKLDIALSLNPRLDNEDNNTSNLGNDLIIQNYKYFLNYINNNLPSYYTVNEAYSDLEYEYLYSLNDESKRSLINDPEFVREYIKFILQNEFETSFFEGINVNFGVSRYIVPISIIVVAFTLTIIVLVTSLYFVYKKKDNCDE